MTDAASELHNLAARVARLEQRLGDVGRDAALALSYLEDDPDSAAAKAGRALEGLLKDVVAREEGEVPGDLTLEQLKARLGKLLPKQIRYHVEQVQRFRNAGAHHRQERLRATDVMPVLASFVRVAEWYTDQYLSSDATPGPMLHPASGATTHRHMGAAAVLLVGLVGAAAFWLPPGPERESDPTPQAASHVVVGAAPAPVSAPGRVAPAPRSIDDPEVAMLIARLELSLQVYNPDLEMLDARGLQVHYIEMACPMQERGQREALLRGWRSMEPEPLARMLKSMIASCARTARQQAVEEVLAAHSIPTLEATWMALSPLSAGKQMMLDGFRAQTLERGNPAGYREALVGQIFGTLDLPIQQRASMAVHAPVGTSQLEPVDTIEP